MYSNYLLECNCSLLKFVLVKILGVINLTRSFDRFSLDSFCNWNCCLLSRCLKGVIKDLIRFHTRVSNGFTFEEPV